MSKVFIPKAFIEKMKVHEKKRIRGINRESYYKFLKRNRLFTDFPQPFMAFRLHLRGFNFDEIMEYFNYKD